MQQLPGWDRMFSLRIKILRMRIRKGNKKKRSEKFATWRGSHRMKRRGFSGKETFSG